MPTYEPKMTDAEFLSRIEQKPFAQGTRRNAHRVIDDQNVVVKQMRDVFPGANFTEHFVWLTVAQTSLVDLFGRCLSISDTGRFLMMERLDDITEADWADIPSFPDWVNDAKPTNFGKTGGEIKLRDYDVISLDRFAVTETDYRPAFAVNAKTNRMLGKR
ncbi:MAG: hypothetical protein A3D16_19685 [Rhodobacterales bacterium RIFCSPHIGHO2_02_FULL_62_130]|nr:MAG: hypothetical protein A3D16_19685 [Rhodobacterales bacterium RIFCSPHIGHO2_02_FULL_62_130]OHC57011.1 MAG: hypothetical protein A3E48_11940 [Rhodobacterales bacterium RIFCSPHIGHO2_12_FULL_62_75]